MIINHNIPALNTHRQLSANTAATNKNIEKLSSGLRINRAGDDAAGLAISEKMRGQIRGLDQASRNAQDGISLIQTAEGALNETHSILQRQREIANQSANGTNTDADRGALQDEMNQLTSEINRIGNTTEFNTQKLLKGDGKTTLAGTNGAVSDALIGVGTAGAVGTAGTVVVGSTNYTQATQQTTVAGAAAAGNTATFVVNGQELKVTFATSGSNGGVSGDRTAYDVTSNSATITLDATTNNIATAAADIEKALKAMIEKNDVLKGNVSTSSNATSVSLSAVSKAAGGQLYGALGNISASSGTAGLITAAADDVGATTYTQASASIGFTVANAAAAAKLVGTGLTINDQQIEFYDATKGAYTGKALGVDIAGAASATDVVKAITDTLANKLNGVTLTGAAGVLTVSATAKGEAGNGIKVTNGGVQKDFETSFQIGANTGQSMSLSIGDMRSKALGITGKAGDTGFTATNSVTDGTNDVKGEAALNIATKEGAAAAIAVLDKATATVSSERSKLGAVQNRLEHTINNLGTASENLTAAESRVRDVDMAKEMMQQTKNNILAQAAQAMLAQANQQPQGVLQLLR